MKVLILGYGASGKAAEALAKQLGYEVEVREDMRPDGAAGAGSGRDSASPAGGADGEDVLAASITGDAESFPLPDILPDILPAFAVVSPGVPLTSPLIAECRRRGIPLKSELQFGCEALKRRGWKLLAVTGSKGKSSVVKVVADAINLAGMHAVACGNYGRPVSDVALELGSGRDSASPADGAGVEKTSAASITGDAESFPLRRYAVVEVSSFMMETTELPADTFEAAAILNLQEDHLDRHGSVEVYHALKRKLLTMAKASVIGEAESLPLLNRDFLKSSNCGGKDSSAPKDGLEFSNSRGRGSSAHKDSSATGGDHLFAGSYFDNDILRANARCAVALMRAAGLNDANIAAAFKGFIPLPHRMNIVAEIDGVCYIDDSKATSLAALVAGVIMASATHTSPSPTPPPSPSPQPSVRLIAGGLPKGDDPKIALPILTKRVKKVYLIGQSAESFARAWKSSVDCEICGTMEVAVAAVKREAVKGDKVLLSPGTASFDQFKSFGERGEVFARLVKKEK